MSIEIQPRQFIGYLLIVLGLILLGYIVFLGLGLFFGTIDVIAIEGKDYPLTQETALFLGVLIQIGVLAILVVASSLLTKFGIQIAIKQREE